MALDTASEGNFTTRNPEDAVKLIDNLASINSTKNIVRARSAAFLGKEQINKVQATLDNVQKLLNKQICSVEDAKRKKKVPKHLKRGVNEKELASFRKRVLRIATEKPFEEAYFSHRLWMFFRETKETEKTSRGCSTMSEKV
ncbi:hypothetical protein Bca101_020414 [Brassica carinata]